MTSNLETRIAAITPRLERLALSMTNGDTLRAEDLLQNAMVRILSTCNDETDEHIIYMRSKSAMLHTIRAEQTYNHVVADETILSSHSDDDDSLSLVWENVSSDQSTPEDELIQREELSRIREAIEQLSPKHRVIIRLIYIGMSPAEISRELGVSRAAISQSMTRISGKLLPGSFTV